MDPCVYLHCTGENGSYAEVNVEILHCILKAWTQLILCDRWMVNLWPRDVAGLLSPLTIDRSSWWELQPHTTVTAPHPSWKAWLPSAFAPAMPEFQRKPVYMEALFTASIFLQPHEAILEFLPSSCVSVAPKKKWCSVLLLITQSWTGFLSLLGIRLLVSWRNPEVTLQALHCPFIYSLSARE